MDKRTDNTNMVANTFPPFAIDEELAGPAPSFPTQRAERVSSLDVLRGFALLGILVVNIEDFGTVEAAHDIPIGTPVDSFAGPHAHWNLAILILKWLFVEGKMRGIFAMLFGAGVILLTTRAEKRGAAAGVADIYTRRNMLLVVFGFLHGAFLFAGDILFDYGLDALLFLYPARKLKATTLILTGLLISLVLGTICFSSYLGKIGDFSMSRETSAIVLRQQQHQPVSVAELAVAEQWRVRVNSKRVTAKSIHASLVEAPSGYWGQVKANIEGRFGPHLALHFLTQACDAAAAMLIGMGLFKAGFLTAKSSNTTYAWTAVTGFAISVPLTVYGILHSYADRFYFLTVEKWLIVPYQLTRDAGMLAIRRMHFAPRQAWNISCSTKLACRGWPYRLLELRTDQLDLPMDLSLGSPQALWQTRVLPAHVRRLRGLDGQPDRLHLLAPLLRVWSSRVAMAFADLFKSATHALALCPVISISLH